MGNDISCCRDGAVSVRDPEDLPPSLTRRSTPTTTTTTTESRYSIGSFSSTGPYEQHVEHQQQEIDVNGNRDEPQLDSPRSASSATVVEAPSQSQQQQEQEQPPQHTPSDAPPDFHSPNDTGSVDDAGPISPRSHHSSGSSSSKEEDVCLSMVASRSSSSNSLGSVKQACSRSDSNSGSLDRPQSPPPQYQSATNSAERSPHPSLNLPPHLLIITPDRSYLSNSNQSLQPMLTGSDVDWRRDCCPDNDDQFCASASSSAELCRAGGSFCSTKGAVGDDAAAAAADEGQLVRRNRNQPQVLMPPASDSRTSSVDSDDLVDAESFYYRKTISRMQKRGDNDEDDDGEEEDPAPDVHWSRPSSAGAAARDDGKPRVVGKTSFSKEDGENNQ